MTLPNGVVANYTYDVASQLTSLLHQLSGSPIASASYTYDAVGNRTSLTDLDGAHNFLYDALNRLNDATHPQAANPAENFTYDPVGNRTSSHLATGQVYDVANRLLDDTNFTYAYDQNGNLTEKVNKGTGDRTVYIYDAENQLIRVEQFTLAGGATPVLVAEYNYDALGRRIEKVVNGVSTRLVYDNEDLVAEMDASNIVRAIYVHGPGIDEPLAVFRGGVGGGLFVYHADGLGSITHLTDSTGTVVRSYTYDSFGQIVAETGTLTNPYTYTGREFDPETGLYYYRNRYYDTQVGRFLSEDPQFLSGLINFYAYVNNNPIRFRDPFGLQPFLEPIRDFKENPTAAEITLALTLPVLAVLAAEPALAGALVTAGVTTARALAATRGGAVVINTVQELGPAGTALLIRRGPNIAPTFDVERQRRTVRRLHELILKAARELGSLPPCFLGP